MEQKHYPVFPLLKGDNRKEKRAMTNEFKRYSLKTAKVEEGFATFIMGGNWGFMSYEDIFKHYMGEYIQVCEKIQKEYKPKYVVMNPEYFKEMYGVENKFDKGGSFAHNLFEILRQRLWFMI